MKLKHLSLLAGLLVSSFTFALSSDSEQPVYIDSNSQELDMKSNKVTFAGEVKLVQGSIEVNGDKIVVLRDAEDGSIQEIEAFGNLATFSQQTDDGKVLTGKAKELYYKMADDKLTMIDDAELMQDDSTVKGDKIVYFIATEKMIADSNEGKRVSTVLQPQPKDKQ
jgi:lipopolysaccharide export system protein LptA